MQERGGRGRVSRRRKKEGAKVRKRESGRCLRWWWGDARCIKPGDSCRAAWELVLVRAPASSLAKLTHRPNPSILHPSTFGQQSNIHGRNLLFTDSVAAVFSRLPVRPAWSNDRTALFVSSNRPPIQTRDTRTPFFFATFASTQNTTYTYTWARTYIYIQFAESSMREHNLVGERVVRSWTSRKVWFFFFFFSLSLKNRLGLVPRARYYAILVASRSRLIIDITERIRRERRERWKRERLTPPVDTFRSTFVYRCFFLCFILSFFPPSSFFPFSFFNGSTSSSRWTTSLSTNAVWQSNMLADWCSHHFVFAWSGKKTWSGPSVMNKLDDTVLVTSRRRT